MFSRFLSRKKGTVIIKGLLGNLVLLRKAKQWRRLMTSYQPFSTSATTMKRTSASSIVLLGSVFGSYKTPENIQQIFLGWFQRGYSVYKALGLWGSRV